MASCDIILRTLGVHCLNHSEKRLLRRDQFQQFGPFLNKSDFEEVLNDVI